MTNLFRKTDFRGAQVTTRLFPGIIETGITVRPDEECNIATLHITSLNSANDTVVSIPGNWAVIISSAATPVRIYNLGFRGGILVANKGSCDLLGTINVEATAQIYAGLQMTDRAYLGLTDNSALNVTKTGGIAIAVAFHSEMSCTSASALNIHGNGDFGVSVSEYSEMSTRGTVNGTWTGARGRVYYHGTVATGGKGLNAFPGTSEFQIFKDSYGLYT